MRRTKGRRSTLVPLVDSPRERDPFVPDDGHTDPSDVFVLWPAMGAPARAYARFARALANASGHPVFVSELRGQGDDPRRGSRSYDYGFAEVLDEDLAGALDRISKRYPAARIHGVGHSIGGTLAILYATTKNSPSLDSIACIGTSFAYWRGFGRQGPVILAAGALMYALSGFLGWFPGGAVRYGSAQPKTMIQDWIQTCWSGRYRIRNHSFRDPESLQNLEGLPRTLIALSEDRMSPKQSVESLERKLSGTGPPTVVHEVSGSSTTHFGWLRDERLCEEIAVLVAKS